MGIVPEFISKIFKGGSRGTTQETVKSRLAQINEIRHRQVEGQTPTTPLPESTPVPPRPEAGEPPQPTPTPPIPEGQVRDLKSKLVPAPEKAEPHTPPPTSGENQLN